MHSEHERMTGASYQGIDERSRQGLIPDGFSVMCGIYVIIQL